MQSQAIITMIQKCNVFLSIFYAETAISRLNSHFISHTAYLFDSLHNKSQFTITSIPFPDRIVQKYSKIRKKRC